MALSVNYQSLNSPFISFIRLPCFAASFQFFTIHIPMVSMASMSPIATSSTQLQTASITHSIDQNPQAALLNSFKAELSIPNGTFQHPVVFPTAHSTYSTNVTNAWTNPAGLVAAAAAFGNSVNEGEWPFFMFLINKLIICFLLKLF